MTDFSVGDVVVCVNVNNAAIFHGLHVGEQYKVTSISHDSTMIIVKGISGGWYKSRFVKYDSFKHCLLPVTFSLEEIEMAKEMIAKCSR